MNSTEFRKTLGKKIRAVRLAQGLSQDRLAKMIGGSSNGAHISRIENGKVGISVDSLYRIAVALDVELCDLVDFRKAAPSILRK